MESLVDNVVQKMHAFPFLVACRLSQIRDRREMRMFDHEMGRPVTQKALLGPLLADEDISCGYLAT